MSSKATNLISLAFRSSRYQPVFFGARYLWMKPKNTCEMSASDENLVLRKEKSMLEIIGLLGGPGFAISGVPTALRAYKEGSVAYIPRLKSWSVFLGAVLMLTSLLAKNGFDWIVTLDYAITIASWATILKYEYFPVATEPECIAIKLF